MLGLRHMHRHIFLSTCLMCRFPISCSIHGRFSGGVCEQFNISRLCERMKTRSKEAGRVPLLVKDLLPEASRSLCLLFPLVFQGEWFKSCVCREREREREREGGLCVSRAGCFQFSLATGGLPRMTLRWEDTSSLKGRFGRHTHTRECTNTHRCTYARTRTHTGIADAYTDTRGCTHTPKCIIIILIV